MLGGASGTLSGWGAGLAASVASAGVVSAAGAAAFLAAALRGARALGAGVSSSTKSGSAAGMGAGGAAATGGSAGGGLGVFFAAAFLADGLAGLGSGSEVGSGTEVAATAFLAAVFLATAFFAAGLGSSIASGRGAAAAGAAVFLTAAFLAGEAAGVSSGMTMAAAAFLAGVLRAAFFAAMGASAIGMSGEEEVVFFMPLGAGQPEAVERPPWRGGKDYLELGIELIHQLVGDFKIGEDVLGVVQFIQKVIEFQHLTGGGGIREGDGGGGLIVQFDGTGGDAALLEESGYGVELADGGDERVLFLVRDDVVRPGFDRQVGHLITGEGRSGDFDGADALKQVGDAAGTAHGAAVFVAGDPDIGRGPVFVIGDAFDEHGHAAGGVGFVGDFLQSGSFKFAGAFFDGPIDVVIGHVDPAGSEEGGAQSGIGIGIFSTGLDGNHDFAGEFAEDLAFPGVNDGFEAFYFGPFVVTCHAGI